MDISVARRVKCVIVCSFRRFFETKNITEHIANQLNLQNGKSCIKEKIQKIQLKGSVRSAVCSIHCERTLLIQHPNPPFRHRWPLDGALVHWIFIAHLRPTIDAGATSFIRRKPKRYLVCFDICQHFLE